TIIGNVIGTEVPDARDLGNDDGIVIINSANNTIGGFKPGEGNIISGNRGDGVSILNAASTKNEVLNNFIGINLCNKAAGNGGIGVLLSAQANPDVDNYATENIIRGNVISGNVIDGVQIFRGTHNTISENLIGVDQV